MLRNVFILEDDVDRRRQFSAVGRQLDIAIHYWHDAHAMIGDIAEAPADCNMISLDCDLIPPDGSEKWGDGIAVAAHLATFAPFAPVIVHSTNRDGSRKMISLLQDAGWNVHRVAPIGDDWITHDWRIQVELLMRYPR